MGEVKFGRVILKGGGGVTGLCVLDSLEIYVIRHHLPDGMFLLSIWDVSFCLWNSLAFLTIEIISFLSSL